MKVRTKPEIHDQVLDRYIHQHLEPSTVYEVIGIANADMEYFRVVDERSEPILYPKYLFKIIDSSIDKLWVRRDYPEGEYHINPPELSRRYFYEDYFDKKPEAIAIFEQFLETSGLKSKKLRGKTSAMKGDKR